MLNAISLSMPLVITFAVVFILFCSALMMYEKREEKQAKKRKPAIYIRESCVHSRRPA